MHTHSNRLSTGIYVDVQTNTYAKCDRHSSPKWTIDSIDCTTDNSGPINEFQCANEWNHQFRFKMARYSTSSSSSCSSFFLIHRFYVQPMRRIRLLAHLVNCQLVIIWFIRDTPEHTILLLFNIVAMHFHFCFRMFLRLLLPLWAIVYVHMVIVTSRLFTFQPYK